MSMLILAFLQLEPGIFALFSHYARGKFPTKKRALLTTFYMLGVETVTAFLFICCLLFINILFYYVFRPENSFLVWIATGILFALAIVCLLCYYRRGSGSQLFITRHTAEALRHYASRANTRSDAFTLGALTSVLEIPFTLPLLAISAISVIELSTAWLPNLFLGLFIILAPLLPLVIIRLKYRAGYNLADFMRARVRTKSFIRLLLCFAYTAIAVLFICDFTLS